MSLYLNLKLWRAERMKMNEAPVRVWALLSPLQQPLLHPAGRLPNCCPPLTRAYAIGSSQGGGSSGLGSKPRYSPSAARSFLGQFRGPTLNSSLLPGSWCPSSPGLGWLGAQCRWREIGARGQSLTLFWIRGEVMESWLVKWMSQGIPNFSTLARECPIITGLTD